MVVVCLQSVSLSRRAGGEQPRPFADVPSASLLERGVHAQHGAVEQYVQS